MSEEAKSLEELVPYFTGAAFVAKTIEGRIEDDDDAREHAHRLRRLATASLKAVQQRIEERDRDG
jgi:hypothetical protein